MRSSFSPRTISHNRQKSRKFKKLIAKTISSGPNISTSGVNSNREPANVTPIASQGYRTVTVRERTHTPMRTPPSPSKLPNEPTGTATKEFSKLLEAIAKPISARPNLRHPPFDHPSSFPPKL